jgi:hypothetical protein
MATRNNPWGGMNSLWSDERIRAASKPPSNRSAASAK